jgi:hypothetical protein
MAVVGTSTVLFSNPNAYTPYFVYPASSVNYGSVGSFNPWPIVYYYQRVWDSGTGGWCYFRKRFVDANPNPLETTPNYTGVTSAHSIIFTIANV